ncbi:hypothetical protein [Streptomyces sp. NPDC018031]|uniref:hypothetical protein n=1 Tax=Streptomyces sp. NPDC018031 TaxID=3365033 RepID=UPI0037A9073B
MPSSAYSAPGGPRPLNADERSEYERLRRAKAMRHRGLRYACGSVLMALTILLAPLSVVAAWVDSEITDTGRYVKTVAPIARDPAVQRELTDRLTDRIADNVDTEEIATALADALRRSGAPPAVVDRADALGGLLDIAVLRVIDGVVSNVVTSDRFAQAWETANRRAHAEVVKVLTGEGGDAIDTTDGVITVDLGTVVDQVRDELVDAGLDAAARIPDAEGTIVLVQTDKLDEAQDLMRLLDLLGFWLPVLIVVLAALAVWVTPAHRVALMTVGVGVGVMMVALLIALAVLRGVYLDSVPRKAQSQDAAAAIYDTFVRFLQDSTRTMLVICAILVVAGYLIGPGRGARALRRLARRGTESTGQALARAGVRTDGLGSWLDRHRRHTAGVVCGLAVLTLLLWNYPTPSAVALVLGVAVVVLAVLAVLAAARDTPGPVAADTGHPRTTPGAAGPAPGPSGAGDDDSGRSDDHG